MGKHPVKPETTMGDATMEDSSKLPADVVAKLRTLAHDLSNSLETILQASYLLGEAKLEDKDKKWKHMIGDAARDAARINREIRRILKTQSSVVGRQSSNTTNEPTTED